MVAGNISCVLTDCEAGFDVEANFVEHLRNKHDIDKNIYRWVNIAKKRAGVDKKPVLEITLDDDDDDEVQIADNVRTEQANNIIDAADRDKSRGQKINFAVISQNVSRNIFANCRQLLEDPQRQKMDENSKINEVLTSEENIMDFFERFRKKVEKTVLPPELVKRLEDSDEEKINLTAVSFPCSDLQADQTSIVERKQYERLLRCPVSDCEFTTDKPGMLRGDAAKHLCDSHGVTARDMTPGKFTFIKIKVEKTQ